MAWGGVCTRVLFGPPAGLNATRGSILFACLRAACSASRPCLDARRKRWRAAVAVWAVERVTALGRRVYSWLVERPVSHGTLSWLLPPVRRQCGNDCAAAAVAASCGIGRRPSATIGDESHWLDATRHAHGSDIEARVLDARRVGEQARERSSRVRQPVAG